MFCALNFFRQIFHGFSQWTSSGTSSSAVIEMTLNEHLKVIAYLYLVADLIGAFDCLSSSSVNLVTLHRLILWTRDMVVSGSIAGAETPLYSAPTLPENLHVSCTHHIFKVRISVIKFSGVSDLQYRYQNTRFPTDC